VIDKDNQKQYLYRRNLKTKFIET